MAIKTATPDLHKRIMSAAAKIGRGVNHSNPAVELEGRRESAKAHIENQILLGRDFLNSEDITELSKLLYALSDVDTDDPEDYTADAVETNAEALERVPGITTGLIEDEDDEDF